MSGEMSLTEFYVICGALVFVFGAFILRPIIRIWSINTLFKTKIKQNPETWAASSVLLDEIKNILDKR